tara:strand:+ start:279 stop:677 length:399 start_codon:yes stop_codon:yes gene_type:complete
VFVYRFEKLDVWNKAMDFCEFVYKKSANFPKSEIYGLTSQLRRASTSIPLNIAEGSACKSKKEFIKFLTIALRSQYESVTIVQLCFRLGYLNEPESDLLQERLAEIGRMLQGLINSLNEKTQTNSKKPKTKN